MLSKFTKFFEYFLWYVTVKVIMIMVTSFMIDGDLKSPISQNLRTLVRRMLQRNWQRQISRNHAYSPQKLRLFATQHSLGFHSTYDHNDEHGKVFICSCDRRLTLLGMVERYEKCTNCGRVLTALDLDQHLKLGSHSIPAVWRYKSFHIMIRGGSSRLS